MLAVNATVPFLSDFLGRKPLEVSVPFLIDARLHWTCAGISEDDVQPVLEHILIEQLNMDDTVAGLMSTGTSKRQLQDTDILMPAVVALDRPHCVVLTKMCDQEMFNHPCMLLILKAWRDQQGTGGQ